MGAIKALLLALCFLLFPCSSSYCQILTPIGVTPNGQLFLDEDSIQPLKKESQLYLLVAVEEHYTNQEFLMRLHQSRSELKKVTRAAYLYLFTNDGLRYAIPQRLLLDNDGNVALDLGGLMEQQPVQSKLLLQTYEKALSVLEYRQMLNRMRK